MEKTRCSKRSSRLSWIIWGSIASPIILCWCRVNKKVDLCVLAFILSPIKLKQWSAKLKNYLPTILLYSLFTKLGMRNLPLLHQFGLFLQYLLFCNFQQIIMYFHLYRISRSKLCWDQCWRDHQKYEQKCLLSTKDSDENDQLPFILHFLTSFKI